MEYKGH